MPLTTNLAHLWRADGSGSLLADDIGGQSLSIAGLANTAFVPGLYGEALALGASLPAATVSNLTAVCTFATWVRFPSVPEHGLTGTSPLDLFRRMGMLNVECRFGSGIVRLNYAGITGPTIDLMFPNDWHHVVCSVDGIATNNRCYVDGALIGVVPFSGTSTTSLELYRRAATGGIGSTEIVLDETAWWSGRALTADEVAELYNAGVGRFYPWLRIAAAALTLTANSLRVASVPTAATGTLTARTLTAGSQATNSTGTLTARGLLAGTQATAGTGTLAARSLIVGAESPNATGTLTARSLVSGSQSTNATGTLTASTLSAVGYTDPATATLTARQVVSAAQTGAATGSLGAQTLAVGIQATNALGTLAARTFAVGVEVASATGTLTAATLRLASLTAPATATLDARSLAVGTQAATSAGTLTARSLQVGPEWSAFTAGSQTQRLSEPCETQLSGWSILTPGTSPTATPVSGRINSGVQLGWNSPTASGFVSPLFATTSRLTLAASISAPFQGLFGSFAMPLVRLGASALELWLAASNRLQLRLGGNVVADAANPCTQSPQWYQLALDYDAAAGSVSLSVDGVATLSVTGLTLPSIDRVALLIGSNQFYSPRWDEITVLATSPTVPTATLTAASLSASDDATAQPATGTLTARSLVIGAAASTADGTLTARQLSTIEPSLASAATGTLAASSVLVGADSSPAIGTLTARQLSFDLTQELGGSRVTLRANRFVTRRLKTLKTVNAAVVGGA